MDVLSEVLQTVRLNGAIFFDMVFFPPWVGQSPPTASIAGSVMPRSEHVINFHVLLEGSCWAESTEAGEGPVRLSEGDAIIFPRGDANVLSSLPGMRADPDYALYYKPNDRQLPFVLHQTGSSGARCHFVCGYLGCDAHPFNPLLDALPRVLHTTYDASRSMWLGLIKLACDESNTSRNGGETILAKASELMFVEAVRHYVERLPEHSGGWLSGLRDPHVGKVLQIIHSRPNEHIPLAELARSVGLSRTVLAERFAHFIGVGPTHYASRWRMQRAAQLLDHAGISIAQVGAEVGYESEAAFNRAFKRHVGRPPGEWRRHRAPVRFPMQAEELRARQPPSNAPEVLDHGPEPAS
jgi:AraC-like DNA-binding protein